MTSSTGRILIVDGDFAAGSLIQRGLNEKGFECDLATDGPEALKCLARHHYVVVVTDLLIPKMNGGELVIRILGQLFPPTIVVYTAVREPEVFDGLRREGINEIILKPTPQAAVVDRIQFLAEERSRSALNSCGREIHKASSWIVPKPAARMFVSSDEWIQSHSGRLETFRFGILFLGCILLGFGSGNSVNPHWSSICSMFGLCGLAFFFCLELAAYYREQSRATLAGNSSRSVTIAHVDESPLLPKSRKTSVNQ